MASFTIFFDRRDGDIEGLFSIRWEDGSYAFEKLQARSGQRGHTHTNWENGLSPIPYGNFFLNSPANNIGQRAGATGIGECFPIDNQGDRLTIVNPDNHGQRRQEICLHEENKFPGTRGCVAIVREKDWLAVRDFLHAHQGRWPVRVL